MEFKGPASEFVYIRTYSRWIDILSRRENWEETVNRYIEFLKENKGDLIPPKVLRKIQEKILSFDVMPSMRALWAAGEAARQDNTTLYNCSFSRISDPQSFSEAFYILMCGTGDGYSVQKIHIDNDKLPIIPQINQNNKELYVVEDSRKGWADSLKKQLTALFNGKDVEFDYSNIRPKGARLKTMGGRASGPAPLITLHNYVLEVFLSAQGRKLTTLECSDLRNQIAESVVVGGVRRSSQIAFSDLDDELMRTAKNWPFHPRRYMANHSAIYNKKPSAVEFLKEWSILASSGTGERGISNLESAKLNTPKRRKADLIEGSNPCVTGDTEILTPEGYVRIDNVIDQEIEIWNGFEWSMVTPKVTGRNQPILTVTLSDGKSLTCTEYHRFEISIDYNGNQKSILARDLEPGMKIIKHQYPIIEHGPELKNAYTTGFISADGMELSKILYVYKPKEMCLKRLEDVKSSNFEEKYNRYRVSLNEVPHSKKLVPITYNIKSKIEWLSGLFDGDGCELKEGGLQLVSVDKQFLLNVQKLLTTVGVSSKVLYGMKKGKRLLPNHNGSMTEYECQDAYRICIGSTQIQKLKQLGLKCERLLFNKEPQRDASQFVTVVDVTDSGIADIVYCFNEPKRHLGLFNGVLTGQCHEIMLRHKEFCNLSEVVIREDDDLDTLLDKVETATWIGVIQSTFTYFPYLSPEWKENCEEERLLGVSLTGQLDNPEILTPVALKALKNKAIKVAKHASQKMGVNMPAAITCVKPSGTVSQLVDSASGLHPRFAKYYIRRYRISGTDPLFKMLRDQGVKMTPENDQDHLPDDQVSTWVLSFPVKAPDNCITRDNMTAIEQLEHYKKIQTNWCEHNASMTVYVKDHEWFEVGNWVYKNWDIINGVSFLPYDGGKYKQAPYEEISKEKYEKLLENLPVIDYSQLTRYELEDNTEGAKSYNCTGDRCEII